jgi:DNA-binding NarL/FixJ family response regulator
MTRVLVVDDHDFFRGCLVDLVNASDDLETVGECRDGAEVAAAVRELPGVAGCHITSLRGDPEAALAVVERI